MILFQTKSVISARSLKISFRKKTCKFTTIGAFVITYKRSMPVTSVTGIDGWAELILPFFLHLILSFTDQDCFLLPQKGHFQTSLRSRRLEVAGERDSRAPVFSCAHYFQAPATQAIFKPLGSFERSSQPILKGIRSYYIVGFQSFTLESIYASLYK